ncbi:MAG: hypothetical protein CW335_08495, partial [Clostridiales bacterium]|nr:hypothetical protein [Clostridiales bacterium]
PSAEISLSQLLAPTSRHQKSSTTADKSSSPAVCSASRLTDRTIGFASVGADFFFLRFFPFMMR